MCGLLIHPWLVMIYLTQLGAWRCGELMCLFQMRDEWVFYGCLSGSGDRNKSHVPKQNVVILCVTMVFQQLWMARCSFKIMVSLIIYTLRYIFIFKVYIYTLRVKEGFILTGYRNNWMSQKNNWQCHQRNLDIFNRKLIIKLNHCVICVTQIHMSKKYQGCGSIHRAEGC